MVSNELAPVTAVEQNSLAVWAEGARSVHALAQNIAQSALVPQAYRGKPVDVLACWLTGQELGIAPMAALRSIDNIQGTPSLRAHAMRALVQSRGHQVEIVESTDERCVMRGRRWTTHIINNGGGIAGGDDGWQTVTWDLDRARKLGLLGRDQWKSQPRTMLIARATGEICRLIAADVLFAVPYSSEEMTDSRPAVRATASVTAADLTTPQAQAEPVIDLGDAEVVDPPEQAASMPAVRKINLMLEQAGVTDREAKLGWISEVVKRTVSSSKDLTRTEAHAVIADLEALLAAKAPEEAGEQDGQGS